jgi:uncharacterized protein with PQ loop repeat
MNKQEVNTMNTETLAYIAGIVSSLIFVSSNGPMLWKVFKTKDMHSYSIAHLVLVNTGNLLYWLYIVSLPLGPIWLLHTFHTVVSVLLLTLYLAWHVYKIGTHRMSRGHDLAQKVEKIVPTLKQVVGERPQRCF